MLAALTKKKNGQDCCVPITVSFPFTVLAFPLNPEWTKAKPEHDTLKLEKTGLDLELS